MTSRLRLHLAGASLLSATEALGGDVKVRVHGLLRGILMVIEYHGANAVVLDSCASQFAEYLSVDSESEFLRRAKWLLAMPFARYLRNEEPKSPAPFALRGAFRRWAKARLVAYSRKNTHLWFSFLQCKRAAVPVSPGIVYETFLKHRKAMETPDPLQDRPDVVERAMKLLRPVLDVIRRRMGGVSDEELLAADHSASMSASLESTRTQGGQMHTLRQRIAPPGLFTDHPVLSKISWKPYEVVVRSGEFGPRQGYKSNPLATDRRDDDLQEVWTSRFVEDARREVSLGPLQAKVEAVLEPLKVRTISKGPSAPYYFAKGFQKAVHTAMRTMPCFRLIGRPVSPTDLIDLLREDDGPSHKWFSGDYEASTDNSSATLGLAILDYLIQDLGDLDIPVYRAALAAHVVHYPDRKEFRQDPIAPVKQTNGQLMGSPVSFPILCLLNAALYLMTLLEHRSEPTPAEIFSALDHVLINGDDILYRATEHEFDRHCELGKLVGLKMSVGKTYFHSRYANVNSVCFDAPVRFDEEPVCDEFGVTVDYKTTATTTPWQINYLNTGLFFGQQKVLQRVGASDEDDELPEGSAISVMNTFLAGALPGRGAELCGIYLDQHRDEINELSHGRNLFIHRSLGGFGVTLPDGFKTKFTWLQGAIAAYTGLWVTGDRAIRPYRKPDPSTLVPFRSPWDVSVADGGRSRLAEFDRFARKSARKRLARYIHLKGWTIQSDEGEFVRHRLPGANSLIIGLVNL